MKSNLGALIRSILMVTTAISCNFFSTEEKAGHPMIGHWELDSLAVNDSSDNIGLFLMAMASLDSSGNNATDFYFTQDSVFYNFNDSDTTKASYRYHADSSRILITEDKEVKQFRFSMLPDSTMVLTGEDSVTLYFKRKNIEHR